MSEPWADATMSPLLLLIGDRFQPRRDLLTSGRVSRLKIEIEGHWLATQGVAS